MPDLSNLPDDDELALLLYIEEFTEEYESELKSYGPQDDTRRVGREFVNNVLSAARALGVTTFSSWQVPKWEDAYEDIESFRLFVKRYVISMQVKQARSGKAYSVLLDVATRERLHILINKIRELLNGANLEERKRNSLFAKLNLFEADIDRSRTRFDNAMAFIIDAANTARTVGESLNPISELLKRVNELLGHAKDAEGDAKLPPPVERKRIEGPKEDDYSKRVVEPDDIPF